MREYLTFDKIIVEVTTRCNLDCPVCYRNKDQVKDTPFEALEKVAAKYSRKIISLCGGEPTVREDLPAIIRLFSRKNRVFLVTNGLRLAEKDYLDSLKKQGLSNISFSFNGFSDNVYERINGARLLEQKLKALENIKKNKINTIISVLMVRGVNENQLKGILEYCLTNSGFIKELRIRSMAEVGRYLATKKFSIQELLDLAAGQAGIYKNEIMRERLLMSSLNCLSASIFMPRECCFDFHLKKNRRGFKACGSSLVLKNKARGLNLFCAVFKAYGIRMVLSAAAKMLWNKNNPWVHSKHMLKIGLRSWPDKIESDFWSFCRTGHYAGGQVLPFCYANLLQENNKERF
jgi:MoaA/NifB/PqqE/SkfB family radical SAM enzyme